MGQRRLPLNRQAMALTALVLVALPAAARAATPGDPFEPVNRAAYSLHEFLDHLFFGPVAHAYKAVLPGPIRKALRNAISNLKEPGVAVNDMLQGHPSQAARAVIRFTANSIGGVGGFIDVAAMTGVPHHDNGFGDTLGRYGAGPGPYIFIPLAGPYTIRDIVGAVADIATDPLTWTPSDGSAIYARTIVGGLDQRAEADEQLKAIDNMSTDPYASLRSLYLQSRAAEIAAAPLGSKAAEPQLPDFDDPGAPPTTVAPPPPPSSDTGAAPVEPPPAR
jgi:phospholipid-binding lipoprotein MlaA